MDYLPNYRDNQPLTWWGKVPVYVTTLLAVLYTAGFVLVAVVESGRWDLGIFTFSPYRFMHGAVWQPLTYSLINELSFFAPFGIMCLYFWGIEVEKYLGRARLLTLFALLVFFQPVVGLGLFGLSGMQFGGELRGNYEILAGLLIAFATLYPNIEYFGWVPLKWFAFACVAAGSLMALAAHNIVSLGILWGECLIAWGYITWLRRGGNAPAFSLRWLTRWRPKLRVLPDPEGGVRRSPAGPTPAGEVDAILDKISRSGFASLTDEERARLEKAREIILRKEEP